MHKDIVKNFLPKGSGMKSGLLFGRPLSGIASGYKLGMKGNMIFALPFGGYEAAMAPRGHKLSHFAGAASGFALSAMIGGFVGGPVGAMIAPFILEGPINEAIRTAAQAAVSFGGGVRRLDMGGHYRDSQMALTMRQRSVQELSRSLMNARQWLGQEGAFLHA